MIAKDWQKRLPQNSSPYTSTIVFLVRKGNPKGIKDWDDLVEAGRPGHHAESEDFRRRALELSGRLGLCAGTNGTATRPRPRSSSKQLYKNVPVLDTGARGSTTTFVQRGIGDVLLVVGERGVPGDQGTRRRQVRDRRSRRQHPGRAAGRRGRQGRRPARGTAQGGRGLPASTSTPTRARRSRPRTTIGRAIRHDRRQVRRTVFPKVELFTIDDELRRLAEGAEDAFRRRRRVRPDLSARTIAVTDQSP